MEQVILVDELDNEIGLMEKLEAHQKGVLHRAFSVMLFNSKGELLVQKRSVNKYHSGGLWTNTCCSHPRPGETIEAAAQRRLMEELHIDITVSSSHSFIYKAELDNGLTEHEFDHVLSGLFDGKPTMNTAEVEDWRFTSLEKLKLEVNDNPAGFTPWFKLILKNWKE
jgi:isopentenyl-diphosphate Delta-isomerase